MGGDNTLPSNVPQTANQRYASSAFLQYLPQLEQQALYQQLNCGKILPSRTDSTTSDWTQVKDSTTALLVTRPTVFVCPSGTAQPTLTSNAKYATGTYACCAGTRGPSDSGGPISMRVKFENDGVFFYWNRVKQSEIRDGTSQTIFLGEVTDAEKPSNQNTWFHGSHHLDYFRTTDNPLNTKYEQGVVCNLYGYKASGAFGSEHTGAAYFGFGDGHVVFLRLIPVAGGRPASAQLDSEGKFTLGCYDTEDDYPAGEYKVEVNVSQQKNFKMRYLVPPRYWRADESGLTVKIEGENPSLTIDVKWEPQDAKYRKMVINMNE